MRLYELTDELDRLMPEWRQNYGNPIDAGLDLFLISHEEACEIEGYEELDYNALSHD
jgi:hypothetical protein